MRKTVLTCIAIGALLCCTPLDGYAAGWELLGSNWIYRLDNQDLLRNEWKKGADDKWRWLNAEGIMETDSWVNNGESYVDSDGIRVENNWLKVNTGDLTDWYHFNSKGVKETSVWRKANDKWFYLDDEGKVSRGWLEDGLYYCDQNGIMLTGWQNLEPMEESDGEERLPGETDSEKVWYYFAPNGRKYFADTQSGVEEKKINGIKYCFDRTGAMLTGWVNIAGTDASQAKISDFRYYNEDGSQRTGWYSLQPPIRIMESYDAEVVWFYFGSDGTPRASTGQNLRVNDFTRIGGKTFVFGSNGVPVHGIQRIYSGNDHFDYYYFGTEAQSNVQKGRVNIIESSGEEVEYYFDNSGKGYSGVKDDKLYYRGKIQTSVSDGKYKIVSMPEGSGVKNYVVNRSGKVAKNISSKDADRVSIKTNASGVLTQYDGSTVEASMRFSLPEEPEID